MRDRRFNPVRLRQLRLDRGLTVMEFAEASGVSLSYAKLLDQAARDPKVRVTPRPLFLAALARALNCRVEDFTAVEDAAA